MEEGKDKKEITTHEGPSHQDILDMIVRKEDEIKNRIRRAKSEAERMVEEAKLEAASMKREAHTAEIGEDLRQKRLEEARREAEKVAAEIISQAERIKTIGENELEKAVDFLIKSVLPIQK